MSQTATTLGNQQQLSCRALYVGQRLDLKAFEQTHALARSPLTVHAGTHGAAVLFRYGVVVLFGLTSVEEIAFLKHLDSLILQGFDEIESEEIELIQTDTAEGVNNINIQLNTFDIERLQLVADVLAKSVVLAHYESALSKTFERIEPLANKLQSGGGYMNQSRELLKHIGDVLLIQGKMVGRVEVSEKPELLWESPQYERLYLRLQDEYELNERHIAIERKLELVSKTAETLLDLLQNKRSLRVEWYIVILIVVEIFLTLYEMWWH